MVDGPAVARETRAFGCRTKHLSGLKRHAALTAKVIKRVSAKVIHRLSAACHTRGVSYYFAALTLLSPLEVKPRSGPNPLTVVLHHRDVPLPVQVPGWLAGRLQTQAPEGVQRVVVYPKTDPEGLLNFTSSLGNWGEPKGDEEAGTFHTVAQVVFVDREEARLVVQIHPNPKGNLRKAFKLTFQTNLELLDQVPKRGGGVEVKGVLKTPSKRLVATELRAVPLPPIRESAQAKKPASTPKASKV